MTGGEERFKMMIDTAQCFASMTSDRNASVFIYNLPEVDADVSYFTALEDEVVGLPYSMLELECNRDCLDGAANFDHFDVPKGYSVESLSCAFKLDEVNFDSDELLYLFLTQDEVGPNIEGSCDRMKSYDEKVLESFCNQPTCDEALDYEAVANCGALKEFHLGDVATESKSPGLQQRDCGAEMTDISSERITEPESTYDNYPLFLDQMTAQELDHVFRRKFGCRPSVIDKQWLKYHILFGLQQDCESTYDTSPLECGISEFEDENSIFLSTITSLGSVFNSLTDTLDSQHLSGEKHVKSEKCADGDSFKCPSSLCVGIYSMDKTNIEDAVVPQVRLQKPTRKSRSGSQKRKSRYPLRKHGISYESSRHDFLHARSHNQHFGAARLVHQEESYKGSDIEFAFDFKVQKARTKKIKSLLAYGSEDCKKNEVSVSNEDFDMGTSTASQHDILEDDCFTSITSQKGRTQKRGHKRWTSSEIKKLIEGVSLHGAGKWSVIKGSLFSSSHRTSINLKDKWRTLVRASCDEVHRKREVEQVRRRVPNKLPEFVLRQVRDLTIMHSNSRRSKYNVSLSAPVVSPSTATKL